jgi:uncharacterized protein (UPF0333 family)
VLIVIAAVYASHAQAVITLRGAAQKAIAGVTLVSPGTSFQNSNELSAGTIIAPPSDAMLPGQVGVS